MVRVKKTGNSMKPVQAVAVKVPKLKPMPKKIGPSQMLIGALQQKKKQQATTSARDKQHDKGVLQYIEREAKESRLDDDFRIVTRENAYRLPKAYSCYTDIPEEGESALQARSYSCKQVVGFKTVLFIDANYKAALHQLAFVQAPSEIIAFSTLPRDVQDQIVQMVESNTDNYSVVEELPEVCTGPPSPTGDVMQSLLPQADLLASIRAGGRTGGIHITYMPFPINVLSLAAHVQVDVMQRYTAGEFDTKSPISSIQKYAVWPSMTTPRWTRTYPSWTTWFLLFFNAGMAAPIIYNNGLRGKGWNPHFLYDVDESRGQIFDMNHTTVSDILYLHYKVKHVSGSRAYLNWNEAARENLLATDLGQDIYITTAEYLEITSLTPDKKNEIRADYEFELTKSACGEVEPYEPPILLSEAQLKKQPETAKITINCAICGGKYTGGNDRYERRHNAEHHPPLQCKKCAVVRLFQKQALDIHLKTNHAKGQGNRCTRCEMTFNRPEGLKKHKPRCKLPKRADYRAPPVRDATQSLESKKLAKSRKQTTRAKRMRRTKQTRQKSGSPVAGPSSAPHLTKPIRRKRVISSDDEEDDDSHIRNIEKITLDELPLHTALSITPAGEVVVLPKVVEEQTTVPTRSLDPLLARYLAAQEISVRLSAPNHPVDLTPTISGLVKQNKATLESAGRTVPFILNATGVTKKVISPDNY